MPVLIFTCSRRLPGKLGLLPKRPVSLVRDPQPAPARRSLDSDDGLEYAENPFEDQKK